MARALAALPLLLAATLAATLACAAATPGTHTTTTPLAVGTSDPPNLHAIDCAFAALAYQVATTKVSTGHAAIHDGLNLGNCSSAPPRPRHNASVRPGRSVPVTSTAAGATAFYVSTSGSDGNAGTQSEPFATLTRARDAVRALGARESRGAVTVNVEAGKYYLANTDGGGTLVLDSPMDSGVTWQAQGGEVVLSGGRLLTGLQWTPAPSPSPAGVMVAHVDGLPATAPTPLPAHNRAHASSTPAGGDYCTPSDWVNSTDYQGNDVGHAVANSTGDCCSKCADFKGCSYFTYRPDTGDCYLKKSAAGARPFPMHVSGSPSTPPPPPPAPHNFGLPPQAVNSLFVNGVRQVRARFPNGNPQDETGLCFSKVQRDGEGCPGYIQAKGAAGGSLPAPPASSQVAWPDFNRGSSPTFGCPQCGNNYGTFHYSIYPPPEGHPVYTQPLPGIGWGNTSLFSFWGSPFSRPAGFTYDPATFTPRTWANASTAVVHMFHSGLWGGWQYRVLDVDRDKHTVTHGFGGYQEARGSGIKTNHYYVENVLEELDAPAEWFYDEGAHQLYWYPNSTVHQGSSVAPASASEGEDVVGADVEVVVPLLDSLIVINGTAAAPLSDITLSGFTITETRTTFLRAYEVPSGGDWSIHRGAAVFVQDAEGVVVTRCTFNQTGGNAVMFSNHALGCEVSDSEFVWIGDSAVALLGSSDRIFGTAPTYPNHVRVLNNLMHETGVFGKQTSCLFQALTANSTIVDNVCFNGPRAGFNFNDGFGGNNTVEGNVLWNAVRETGDHGPVNSWDRQPYLTYNGVDDGFNSTTCPFCPPGSSVIRANDTVTRNLIINGYNGVWTLDRDDGSQYVRDVGNLLVYGGCKNYLGHSKTCESNVIIHPGAPSRSAGGRACQTDDGSGSFANMFHFSNRCVTQQGSPYSYGGCDPSHPPGSIAESVYHTRNNTFFAPAGAFSVACGKKQYGSLPAWQGGGQDAGSTVADMPTVDAMVAMGKQVLGL